MQRSIQFAGLLSFIALVAAAGPAQAQMKIVPYVGLDIIKLSTKIDDQTGLAPSISGKAEPTTARLRGGLHVFEYLDAEMHILIPRTDTYSTTTVDNTVKTNVTGAYAKPNFTMGPVNVYALVGFASAYFTLDGSVTGKQKTTGASYGAGVQYLVNQNWAVSLDFMHYFKHSFPVGGSTGSLDFKGDSVGLGVNYTFR